MVSILAVTRMCLKGVACYVSLRCFCSFVGRWLRCAGEGGLRMRCGNVDKKMTDDYLVENGAVGSWEREVGE